ncbi:MAG: S-layer homology domain-containing protein [Clostridia bacterium]|nr:S-layer homology domain-containing protein [Clostridia bacterium]
MAAIETNNIEVSAYSFDNKIYDEYQKVVITSDSIDFTKYEDSLTIDLSGTDKESIKNITIVGGTIEFDMLTYGVPEGLYALIVKYKDGFIPVEQWEPNAILVKEGHFIFNDEPAVASDALVNGITVKFYNVEIDTEVTAMIDNVFVKCTKVSDRVFRIYPTEANLVNKDSIDVRLIVPSGYYFRTIRVVESDVYLEKEIYSREEPFSFYINSKTVEFPMDSEDISVTISGNNRFIDVTDLIVYNSNKIKALTPLPLAAGTYQMAVTWNGTSEIYKMDFQVVTQGIKDNNELDKSVLDFFVIDGLDLKLTLFDNQVLRYVDSSSKTIDLSMYDFDSFSLDLRNSALLILLENNLGLNIKLKEYQFEISKQSLEAISTKDAYIVASKQEEFPAIDVRYIETSDNLYIDSNITGMKISVPFKQNVITYNRIEALVKDVDLAVNVEKAYLSNNMVSFTYQYTGTYKAVIMANTFSDVSSNYWGLKYISPLTAIGIIDGMGGGKFAPEGNITRAQFAKLIAVSVNLPIGDGLSYFQDIYTTAWYYKYVVALEKANIVDGAFFQAENSILRKDMAVMVMRAYAYYTGEDLQQLADNSFAKFNDLGGLTSEQVTCIMAAQQLGIIDGMSTIVYAPNSTATRAQAAAIIYRFMKVLELL